MDFTKHLIVFSVVNAIVLWAASRISGGLLVFGNVLSDPTMALIKTSILLAVVVSLVAKIGEVYKLKFSDNVWMFIYLAVNVVTLYLLARSAVSDIVGVGVRAYWVAVVLGVVINLVQYFAWKAFLEVKKK